MNLKLFSAIVFGCFFALALANPLPGDEEVVASKPNPEDQLTFDEILLMNKEAGDDFYEGDIVQSGSRNGIADKTKKWSPLTIPYDIAESYNYFETDTIEFTLAEFNVRTCLTFVPRTTEANYIKFHAGSGCSSSVGMMGGGQTISLGGGCVGRGIIIHEVLHALGFWHEQSRTDRDDWIRVVWDVISEGKEYNFNKYENDTVDLMDVPYDYSSIMHYSTTSFSKNGSATIIGLQDGKENIGQRAGFSYLDLNKLNSLYECGSTTDAGGYTQWTEYSACNKQCTKTRKRFCDDDTCEEWGKEEVETVTCDDNCIVGEHPDCGAKILTDPTGFVASPNYPYNYVNSAVCKQTIYGPVGSRIFLHFQRMDVEDYNGGCYYDYVHVHDGEDSSAPKIGTYCSTIIPGPIASSGNSLSVIFDSDYSEARKGFRANYVISNAVPVTDCNFEQNGDYCGWTQDTAVDQLDFTFTKGGTPSDGTGPASDHTLGTAEGAYLFLETSSPAVYQDKARLVRSFSYACPEEMCFSMWYSMYGINTGTLDVYQVVDGVDQAPAIISLSGDLGNNAWHHAFGTFTANGEFQVAIEAMRGNGYRSDIAIDDVQIIPGPCPFT